MKINEIKNNFNNTINKSIINKNKAFIQATEELYVLFTKTDKEILKELNKKDYLYSTILFSSISIIFFSMFTSIIYSLINNFNIYILIINTLLIISTYITIVLKQKITRRKIEFYISLEKYLKNYTNNNKKKGLLVFFNQLKNHRKEKI